MSTRQLRVQFVGDASSLKGAFNEVSSSATQASTTVRSSAAGADDAGKAFTRVGRTARGFGRAFKGAGLDATAAGASFASSIPALSGMAGGLGIATTAADALASSFSSFSPVALLAIGGAAIAAGIAFKIMSGNADVGAAALDDLEQEANQVATASSRAAAAQRDLDAAVRGVSAAQRDEERAALAVTDAQKKHADAVNKSGRNSRAAKEAALDLADAEAKVADSKRATINTTQQAIRLAERSSIRADNEVKQAREAAAQARITNRLILLTGANRQQVAAASKAAASAEDRLGRASQNAEKRHRANAARAKELSSAITGTSAAANTLRGRLDALARKEINLANAISQMRELSTAAAGAAGSVGALISALSRVPSAGAAVAGLRRGIAARAARLNEFTGPGRKSLDEVKRSGLSLIERGASRRGVAGGSPVGLERTAARGEHAAETARITAERGARAGGKTEEQIRIAGERAYIAKRLGVINNLRNKMKTRYANLVKKLKAARRARAAIKVPSVSSNEKQKAARDKALAAREALTQKINGILDELETLAANDADLRAEQARLGEDKEGLKRDEAAEEADIAADAAEGAAVAGDTGPTPEDFLEAGAAEAALTPGVEDDIAVAEQAVAHFERSLAAARGTGDPRLVAAAAQALQQARQNLEQLKATRDNTDAVNANTDALTRTFGGSNVISYRGQDSVLGRLSPPSSDRLTGMEVGL